MIYKIKQSKFLFFIFIFFREFQSMAFTPNYRGVQKTHRLAKPDPTRTVGQVFRAWWVELGYNFFFFIVGWVGFGL